MADALEFQNAEGHVPCEGGPTGSRSGKPVKVVIAGAGPAGLMLAHCLLTHGEGQFEVLVLDRGDDPRVTVKKGLDSRRWSITLSRRAEHCFSLVPGLVDQVRDSSVQLAGAAIVSSAFKAPTAFNARPGEFPGWVQDRVALCATLLQALLDSHAPKAAAQAEPRAESDIRGPQFCVRFGCAVTGVDLQRQKVTFAAPSGDSAEESYDLLVGADGLRSAVRMAFQQQLRDFEIEQRGLFSEWGVAHYEPPKGLATDRIYMVPKLPRTGGISCIGMPSVHGQWCFIMGWNYVDRPRDWLACSTPEEAHQYLHSRLPQFEIPKEVAWKLRSSPLQGSSQVKCWQYHDSAGHAVLIGDAAHATSPSLGCGCNSSIVDATVLGRLLTGEVVSDATRVLSPAQGNTREGREWWSAKLDAEKIRARLPALLSRFSALQVKEGQAVVDLSDAFAPVTPLAKAVQLVVMLVLMFLSRILPFLFPKPLQGQVFNNTKAYSQIKGAFWAEADYLLWAKQGARKKWFLRNSAEVVARGITDEQPACL